MYSTATQSGIQSRDITLRWTAWLLGLKLTIVALARYTGWLVFLGIATPDCGYAWMLALCAVNGSQVANIMNVTEMTAFEKCQTRSTFDGSKPQRMDWSLEAAWPAKTKVVDGALLLRLSWR